VKRRARVKNLAVVLASMIVLGILAGASTAVAQEYGESRGSLGVKHYVEVSGSGFSANSAVKMKLVNDDTGETTDLGTLTSDDSGELAGSVALPEGLAPGAYTLTVTGVTDDGVTRVLSAGLGSPVVAAGEEGPGGPLGGMSVWLIAGLSVLALALAGDGWRWIANGRNRRRAERQAAPGGLHPEGLPGQTVERPGWLQPSPWPSRGQGEAWGQELDL